MEGMTWSATEVTLHTLTWAELDDEGVDADEFIAAAITPPITPPTTSAAPSAAQGSQRCLFCPCFDPFISSPGNCGRLLGLQLKQRHGPAGITPSG